LSKKERHADLPTKKQRPSWDSGSNELRVGHQVVKKFKQPSAVQKLILQDFEELGWPCSIDDPLPPNGRTRPKTRLHDAIIRLNRHQKSRLIRFAGDGTGTEICWEWIKPPNG